MPNGDQLKAVGFTRTNPKQEAIDDCKHELPELLKRKSMSIGLSDLVFSVANSLFMDM